MLQRFVRTRTRKGLHCARQVFASEKPTSWKLKAFKYYYIPSPPVALLGLSSSRPKICLGIQQKIIDAVTPFTEKTGTPGAFMSTEDARTSRVLASTTWPIRDNRSRQKIQSACHNRGRHRSLFERYARGTFEAFTFSPAGASVYHLAVLVQLVRNSRPWC